MHVVQESSIMNRSRINCHLYIDVELKRLVLPQRSPQGDFPANLVENSLLRIQVTMNQCNVLHQNQRCSVHFESWLKDQLFVGEDLAAAYEAETESEADVEGRVGETEDEDEPSLLPNSSFGF